MKYLALLRVGITFGLLSMLLVGCGLYGYGYNPGPPPDPKFNYDFSGNWKGSLEELATNARTAQVTVTMDPHGFAETIDNNDFIGGYYNLRGTWKAEFSETLSALGILEGTASAYDSGVYVVLTFGDDPNCAITINASRNEDTISGTYRPGKESNNYAPIPVETGNCSFTDIKAGRFEVKKQ